jgi:hypothetical protein
MLGVLIVAVMEEIFTPGEKYCCRYVSYMFTASSARVLRCISHGRTTLLGLLMVILLVTRGAKSAGWPYTATKRT